MQQPPIPEVGFLRIAQICGDKKRGIAPIIPVCRSAWWCGVKSGRFPKGVLLGPKTRAWKAEDIRELITTTSAAAR
jgi:prophage regulatory protein